MPLLQMGSGFSPCQVDSFSDDCERSREGAIYLRPRSVEEVTEDELAEILRVRPDLRKFMTVARPAKKKAAPAPAAAEQAPASAPSKSPESSGPSKQQESRKASSRDKFRDQKGQKKEPKDDDK